MSCQNNLKQIALAAANYESSYGKLPYGKNRITEIGPLALLLPYVEQANLYNQLSPYNIFQIQPSTVTANHRLDQRVFSQRLSGFRELSEDIWNVNHPGQSL